MTYQVAPPAAVRRTSTAFVRVGAIVLAAALGIAGCGGDSEGGSDVPDDGSELTMWVRGSGPDTVSQALVDAYNAGHENQIDLTVVPGDNYQQVVGAAAGAGNLPDLLAADVVYSPNYVEQGLYLDITERVEALPFVDQLTPAHSQAASNADGQIFGVPHVVDSSLFIYNKDLYAAAGLDPESPPATFQDVYDQAAAVRALGGDTYGFFWAGNCAGCNAYTVFPMLAAAGSPPVEAGQAPDLDSDAMTEVLSLYQRMYADDIMAPSSATESGATWPEAFVAGNVGLIPIGNFAFGPLVDVDFDWGIAPFMAPDGSATSTFVGGDVIGISATSQFPDQAWDFISWSLSDEAQVDVVAQAGGLPARVDLADNEFSGQDERVVATIEGLATGYTPSALAYGEVFNTATGPWLTGLRAAVIDGQDVNEVAARMQQESAAILENP